MVISKFITLISSWTIKYTYISGSFARISRYTQFWATVRNDTPPCPSSFAKHHTQPWNSADLQLPQIAGSSDAWNLPSRITTCPRVVPFANHATVIGIVWSNHSCKGSVVFCCLHLLKHVKFSPNRNIHRKSKTHPQKQPSRTPSWKPRQENNINKIQGEGWPKGFSGV